MISEHDFDGRGKLTSLNNPSETWDVEFHFRIRQTTVERGGLVAPGRASGVGRITVPGQPLSFFRDGEYSLATESFAPIRLQCLGGQWHVLASVTG